ncbi:MAG: Holliday junction resolvase RuvX [Cytophagales bacterium]|nr:Holliday junction resolvase RuvX [Cytophagales bacterium]
MGRIMAFDYGSKRVGIAVTDTMQIIASALDTVHSKDVVDFVKKYMAGEQVDMFVIGMPVNLKGEATNNTPLAQAFVNRMKKQFPDIPIHLHDERFTSKIAMQAMISGGMKKKDRRQKGNVDKISAAVILQSFMQSRGL